VAALFAALAGMLFGALAVAVRDGLRRGGDPEAGAFVIASVGFLVGVGIASGQIADGFDVADLWPFVLAGAIVPGATQILFILAIRHAGPSRASVLIGTAPPLGRTKAAPSGADFR
jgi:drug/metabolite transporter (DMT)-like permease